MPSPEQWNMLTLKTELRAVADQLERTDENENPIERLHKREELLERYDALEDELASSELNNRGICPGDAGRSLSDGP